MVDAVGAVSAAFEVVEHARGMLYAFHRLTGRADAELAQALDQLAEAGHPGLADELRAELVGRNVLPGRWTFQVVEEYDAEYYRVFEAAEKRVRDELMAVVGTCTRHGSRRRTAPTAAPATRPALTSSRDGAPAARRTRGTCDQRPPWGAPVAPSATPATSSAGSCAPGRAAGRIRDPPRRAPHRATTPGSGQRFVTRALPAAMSNSFGRIVSPATRRPSCRCSLVIQTSRLPTEVARARSRSTYGSS